MLSEEAGATNLLSHVTCYLAWALQDQGRVDEAQDTARQALALAQQGGEMYVTGVAWRLLGQAVDRASVPVTIAGTAYGAEACFAESLRVPHEAGLEAEAARTVRAWADYARARGERIRAADLWREAQDTFARLGMAQELAGMADQPADDGSLA